MCVYSGALEDKVKVCHEGFSDLKIRLVGERRTIKPKCSSLEPLDFCLPAPSFLVQVFICLLFHIDVRDS